MGQEEDQGGNRLAGLMALFLAAAVTLTAGCSSGGQGRNHICIDKNNDGLCDVDGQPMTAGGGTGTYYGGGRYYSTPHFGTTERSGAYSAAGSGVTRGVAATARGGIGSAGGASGG